MKKCVHLQDDQRSDGRYLVTFCGYVNTDSWSPTKWTTTDIELVTCGRCKRTDAWQGIL